MCGIVGIKFSDKKEIIDEKKFLFFLDSLKHRGPDGKGVYLNKKKNLALGHQRLSIYDTNERSNQPLQYLDRYLITFNGSIYNYLELKEKLLKKNYKFNTTSDTEVILASYHEWGNEAVKKFNGIWAFAIYDKQNENIFISRDRFGVKPLYYYQTDKIFAFASELKSFLYLYNFEKIIDYEYIDKTVDDIQKVEISKNTYFKNVYKLLPGENILIDKNFNIHLQKYWDLKEEIKKAEKEKKNNSFEILNKIEKKIKNACVLRNRSDVSLSVSLSGGLDSSIILYNLLNINKDKINAFYLRYTEKNFNEDEYVHSLKKNFKFDLSITDYDFDLPFDEIKDHLFSLDDIYYHLLIGPLKNYKAMKNKKIKVSIDGQGADELFCGYTQCINDFIFFSPNLKSFINRYLKYSKVVKDLNKGTYNFKVSFFVYLIRYIRFKLDKFSIFFINISTFINKYLFFNNIQFLSSKILELRIKKKYNSELNKTSIKYNSLNDVLINYFSKVTLPNILRVYDRVSMKNAVEVRMPFLDYNLVKYCFNLNPKYKLKNNTKVALRKIYENKLPKKIIERKSKVGFVDPMINFFLKYKSEILDLFHEKKFEKFKLWNISNLSEYVKLNYKNKNFNNLSRIWPFINYCILLDKIDSVYKKNISKKFLL